jgi:alcohol dehydrogenase class IV
MMFDIAAPSIMKFGRGVVAELGSLLQLRGITNPLIVTGKHLVQSPLLDKVTRTVKRYAVFSEVGPDPDMSMVVAGLKAYTSGNHDALIGFGGGSPMDAAKLINLSKYGGVDLLAWRVPASPAMTNDLLVCIPTTAGTGSEVTRGAVVTNPANQEKVVFMGPACLADIALVDPDFIDDLPARIAADTGLDALTHALESLVSKKSNVYTETMARLALRLIGTNLKKACLENDSKAKEAMMFGASYAGMAFSNSSVAMVHGMSRPLGSFFHIPHGLSNAMLLPSVTDYSVSSAAEKYAEAARLCGFANDKDTDTEGCEKLVSSLNVLCKELSVPSLAGFGVDKEEYHARISEMTGQAIGSGSPGNNPRVPDPEDVKEIYIKLWR